MHTPPTHQAQGLITGEAGIAKPSGVLTPVFIEKGMVINVNVRDYIVDTFMDLSPQKPKFDIPWMTPYCHQSDGEGIDFMPEAGSTCWICSPSEGGDDAFVIGWAMTEEDGAFRGGRDVLNPGDIQLRTRDRNFVTLRRGGIVQIGSTPVCQRVYLPIRNIIQDYAENYELHTPAGDLTWTVARAEEDGNAHQQCLYSLSYKEFSDDPNEKPVGLLKMGSHGDGETTILSLLTRNAGGGSAMTTLEIAKDGEIKWTMKKFTFKVEGDASLTVDGLFQLIVGGVIDISAVGALTVSASSMALSAGGAVLSLGGGSAGITGEAINLGEAAYHAVRAHPSLLSWINAVTATLAGNPATPGAPVLTVPPFAALLPLLHVSTKVKV